MALPILFVPGMLCDERLFRPQIARLGPARTVSVADLAKDDTIEAMATRALRDAPDGKMIVAGLSLGGIVAMEMLRIAPERIARLVLMATNHRAATPSFITTRHAQLARARQGHFRDIVIDDFKASYFSPYQSADPALQNLIASMAMNCGIGVFEAQSNALIGRRDQTATLTDCRCPTLLMVGADDRLCPVATHQEMARIIPGSRLVILPATGHVVTLEQPVRSSELLEQFSM